MAYVWTYIAVENGSEKLKIRSLAKDLMTKENQEIGKVVGVN